MLLREAYYGVMKTVARELNTFPVLMEGLSKVAFKAGDANKEKLVSIASNLGD